MLAVCTQQYVSSLAVLRSNCHLSIFYFLPQAALVTSHNYLQQGPPRHGCGMLIKLPMALNTFHVANDIFGRKDIVTFAKLASMKEKLCRAHTDVLSTTHSVQLSTLI